MIDQFNPYVQIVTDIPAINEVLLSMNQQERNEFMLDLHHLVYSLRNDHNAVKRENFTVHHRSTQEINGRYYTSQLNVSIMFDFDSPLLTKNNMPKGDYAFICYDSIQEVDKATYTKELRNIKSLAKKGEGRYMNNRPKHYYN